MVPSRAIASSSKLRFFLFFFTHYDFNGYAGPYARSYVYDGGAGPPVAAPARVSRLRGPGTIAEWGTALDSDW